LSAYSVPLELAVETGIPGLLAGLGLLVTCQRMGLNQLQRELLLSLPALGALAAVLGMASHGIVDTIFFRPEVQMTGWFALATLGAAQSLVPSHRH
jgi:putative inorganic carbon (HCO3(-)) transporter